MTQPEIILLQVVTTCATREEAERVGEALVAARLAACVQIHSPITSIYRWQGQIERSEECLLVAKTLPQKFNDVAAAIRQQHSYQTPQIIGLPVVEGTEDYVAWLREQVTTEP
jgi:periplasmic divalent cation tolerance protein